MWAIHYENIFRLRFSKNPNSNTSHTDRIAEKETHCFPFHARINKNTQNHSSTEKRRYDENHLPKTYRPELPVQMPLSMQDADQQPLPMITSHHKTLLLSLPCHYCWG